MNIIQISIDDALDKGYLIEHQVKYALAYLLNEVKLLPIEEFENVEKDLIIEARFFSENKEVHVFKNQGKLEAVLIEDGDREDCIKEKQILMEVFGKGLIIKNYIEYDSEDNQAYISYSRPCDVDLGGEYCEWYKKRLYSECICSPI